MTPIRQRIQYFNWVRDIPYSLHLDPEKPDYSCDGKHRMLMKLLHSLGLEVRPRICETGWSDFVELPQEVLDIPHDDDLLHVYLDVRIGNRWRRIDASIDSGLGQIFTVNEWDGYNDTPLCLEPGRIYTPKQSLHEFEAEPDFQEGLNENMEFYLVFNQWISGIRNQKE